MSFKKAFVDERSIFVAEWDEVILVPLITYFRRLNSYVYLPAEQTGFRELSLAVLTFYASFSCNQSANYSRSFITQFANHEINF